MAGPESEHIYGVQLRESADDGSDFASADADYRIVFLGEDGELHKKDSAGSVTGFSGSGAPSTVDYLVGTASGSLSAEIVVGTSPAGELGGTWASPTVDTTHSGSPHAIVQVKTAVLSSDFTTTAATMQDTGLSLAFTPLFSDSILHVRVDGECSFQRVAGTIAERYGLVDIYNDTNSVVLTEGVRGQILVATSAVASNQVMAIALKGTYTVNSTAARTFKFRIRAGVVTNVEAKTTGTRTGGTIMTIEEVRP